MNKIILAILTFLAPAGIAGTIDDHNQLLRAVDSTGVTVKINPKRCDEQPVFGWYWASQSELVICQENKVKGSSRQVEWTAEDLDTVRHEAHHLAQDCRDGKLQGDLDSVYQKPIQFALKVMGKEKGQSIVNSYRSRGEHIVVMELEAFAVAALNDPLEQVGDINTYCF